MKRYLGLLVAAFLSMGQGPIFMSGGGGVANTYTLASGSTAADLYALTKSIPQVFGIPPNVAYSAYGATAGSYLLDDKGVSFDMGTLCQFFPPDMQYDRVRVVLRKVGTPVGNLRMKVCTAQTTDNVAACGASGATYATSNSIAASAIPTTWDETTISFPSLVEMYANTPFNQGIGVPAFTPSAPDARTILEGDATYDTNDFTPGTGDYIEVLSYTGGLDCGTGYATKRSVSDIFDTSTGTIIPGYMFDSRWDEYAGQTIVINPGNQDLCDTGTQYGNGIQFMLPPNTTLTGSGASSTRFGCLQDNHSRIVYRGDATLKDIEFLGMMEARTWAPFRGRPIRHGLRQNTSTASPNLDIRNAHGGSDVEPAAGDVIRVSEAGLPTAYYKIVTVTPVSGASDTAYIRLTLERNLDVVYTGSKIVDGLTSAYIDLYKKPVVMITNIKGAWFPELNQSWSGMRFEIYGSRLIASMEDPTVLGTNTQLSEFGSHRVVTTIGYPLPASTPTAMIADSSAWTDGFYKTNGGIVDVEGNAPSYIPILYKAAASRFSILNQIIESNLTGTNNVLTIYRALGTGKIVFRQCNITVVAGTVDGEIDGATATVEAYNCDVPAPTLTGGATMAQFTKSPSFGSATAAASPANATVTVNGCKTTMVAQCSSSSAACDVNSVAITADATVVAGHTGCVGGETIRCSCQVGQ